MIQALYYAIRDTVSRDMRAILIKSIALSIGLFVALWFGVNFALTTLDLIPWVSTLVQWVVGVGIIAPFFFLMAPVTALFAGLFQDGMLKTLEKRHYAKDQAGEPLSGASSIFIALKFASLSLGINLLVWPTVFLLGFGFLLLWIANAYLISREYFTMTAARYMPLEDAIVIRKENALRIFIAGLAPGALALVPFINFTTPVFATSYFLHLFKRGQPSLF